MRFTAPTLLSSLGVAGLLAGATLLTSVSSSVVPVAAAQADAYLAAQKAQVIGAVYHLDAADFHALEEGLSAGAIPPGALGTVRRARVVTQAVDWPAPLVDQARQLGARLTELEAALRTEDPTVAAGPAQRVHDLEHDLSTAAYAWLAGGQSDGGAAAHPAPAAPAMSSGAGHMHTEVYRHLGTDAAPTLQVKLMPDTKSGYNLQVETSGWTWAPEKVNAAPTPGEGHAHIYVDGTKIARLYGPWFHLDGLTPGEHAVRVTLNANDHAEYATSDGTILEQTVTVTVAAPGAAPAGDGHGH